MYSNGKQVEGYLNKRQHKRKMKERYANKYWWGGSGSSYHAVEVYHDKNNWGAPQYWKEYSLSGPRQYAKDLTNSKIRSNGRLYTHLILLEDYDDIPTMINSSYRKIEDYAWTVW